MGLFQYSDGKFHLGLYKEGVLNGLGRLNMHNEDVFDGFLKNSFIEGKGVYYQHSSNFWVFGIFANNKCL